MEKPELPPLKKRKVHGKVKAFKKRKRRKKNRIPDKVRDDCYRHIEGGFTKEMTCPGCLKTKIEFKKYLGWHASHIRPFSKGGTNDLWNLYPLCINCNGDMGGQNMFCYFFHTEAIVARMIKNMHQLVRRMYPEIYRSCNKQFYQIACKLYRERTYNDGGIPKDHPIWKLFLKHDILQNTKDIKKLASKLQVLKSVNVFAKRQYDCF